MAAYYGDSSALAKRYVREVGSAWMMSLVHPTAGNVIFTALVTGAEVVAALARRARMGSIPAHEAARVIAAFRGQFRAEYQVVGVSDAILDRAMDLAERHGLRGYDAIQLACALTARRTVHRWYGTVNLSLGRCAPEYGRRGRGPDRG